MPNSEGDINLRVEGLGQFQRDLTAASNSVKSLGTASKLADSEMRATGNAADYVKNKTAALTSQIHAQERAVQAAARGLQAAEKAYGANSRQVQQWQSKLNTAKTGLNNLQAELRDVQNGTDRMQRSMKGASQETEALGRIANSTRFTAFNTALNNMGNTVANVGRKITQLGKQIWSTAKDSAAWADELATNATKYGLDTSTLQQWEYAAHFVDVEVSTLTGSWSKLLSGMKAGKSAFGELGVSVRTSGGALRSAQEVFWDCIGALNRMTDETARDAAAQEIFGKSFAELKPLIDAGRSSWERYCDEAERAGLVLSADQIRNLTSFNDSIDRMNSSFDALVRGTMSELAPGFQEIADAVTEVTQGLLEWMQTDEGKETLHNLTEGIKAFVEALAGGEGKENIIQRITGAVTGLGEAISDTAEHARGLIDLLKGAGIGIGLLWGTGKIVDIATNVKTLFSLGGGASAGGASAGAATGGTAAGGTAAGGGALSALATGALGFTGGIAAVLGVGALIKAMAGESRTTDWNLAGDSTYRANRERNEQRRLAIEEANHNDIISSVRDTTNAIVGAIEDLQGAEERDWRVQQNRERASGLTAEDITEAIEASRISLGGGNNDSERPKTNIELNVEMAGSAIEVALHDGKVSSHELGNIRKYIKENFDPAVEEAVTLINGGWQRILDAMDHPPEQDTTSATGESGSDGTAAGTGGSTFLTGKVAELVTVRGEIQELVDYIAAHAGEVIDQTTINKLASLVERAESLSAEVGWYDQPEQRAGRGAMGLAMQGKDIETTVPAALAYIENLRKHEIESIDAEIAALNAEAGNRALDYFAASDQVRATEGAGVMTHGAALLVQQTAQALFNAATDAANEAEASREARVKAVNDEYQDNLAEIMAGAAAALGYNGEGKATYQAPSEEDVYRPGLSQAESDALARSLSGFAMGGGRNWGLGSWAGTEIGSNLMAQQAGMTPQQKAMAMQLSAQYGSYGAFLASLPADQRSMVSNILNGKAGSQGEMDYWSNMMYAAFGRLPNTDAWDYNKTVQNPFDEGSDSIAWLKEFLDFTMPEAGGEAGEERRKQDAEAAKEAIGGALAEYTDAYNEASGYNDYAALVKSMADAGVFKGMDWSEIDGGVLEDTLFNLAEEAAANGEEVGDLYGTGLESSAGKIFTAAELAGGQADAGFAAGVRGGQGAVTAAINAMVSDAVRALRQGLDIRSPSHVMEGLGDFTGKGFAVGIRDSVGDVRNAVDSMLDAVRTPTARYVGGVNQGGSYSSSSAIYIDKYQQNSAEDIDYLRQQLEGLQKRQLQGYGHRR